MNKEQVKGRDSPVMKTGPPDWKGDNKSMNSTVVISIGNQISETSKRISSLAVSLDEIKDIFPEAHDQYESILLDEVAHLQVLTLQMTELVTEEDGNADDSVFAEGELNSVVGEKKGKDPETED